MTQAEVSRLRSELYPEETWQSAAVRARVNDADLSVREHDDIVRSLGGILCSCQPVAHPLGPAGYCEDCKTEGPFRQEIIASFRSPVIERYKTVDWQAAFKEEPEDIRWLKEDFLEHGTLSCLFSKPGIGKSLIALEVALEIVRNGRTVAYFDDENRRDDVVERLKSFRAKPEELDRLVYFSFQSLPPLDTPLGGEHLDALAEYHRPDLVVIDTVSRMVMGPENDSDTYLSLYRNSLTKMKRRDIAVLRLDHVGKDEKKGQRGSSAKESDADVLWHLSRDGEETYALECEKSRSGHIAFGTIINLQREYEPLRHVWDVHIDMPLSRYQAIMRQMDLLGISPSYGRDRVRKIFRDNGVVGVRNDQLGAAIIERRNRIRRLSPVKGTERDGGTD